MTTQLFPPLDAPTEAALRASIERFGVLVPVVHDQDGRILDGHHRSRIAGELDVAFRVDVRAVGNEDEAHEIARTLNADRRHLAAEQRRPVVVALREDGHSLRAIGGALGVSAKTIHQDLAESGVTQVTPDRVEGQDGKSYPATRPKAEPMRRTPLGRRSNTQPFTADNKRRTDIANGQKSRLIDGLSQINGICRGLRDIDYGMTAAVLPKDELLVWATKADELARALRGVKSKLTEVSNAL